MQTKATNPWVIAGTVMLATFMEVLDTSVANVALPHIAGSLGATVEESTWVLTSYLVANAIVLPLSGWLSALFGRKRFYITCVILFTVSSALCGIAPSLGALIFFRILQGLGGGALQPISQAILVESFPQEKRGMAMAVYGMGVVVAPIIGPTLGGWITDNYTWRWIFLINVPVGVLSVMLTTALIFDPPFLKRLKGKFHFDGMGLGLMTLGLASLEIVLDEGQRNDWFASPMIVTFSVLAALGLLFAVMWELRQKDPIIDLNLLRDRNFALATASMFLLGFVLYGSTMLLPVMLQTLLGYSATSSGLVLSPGGLAIVFAMPVVGYLLAKVEARWLIVFGCLVSASGLFMMARFNLGVDMNHAVWARIVQSAGLAFLFVPINTVAFAFIDHSRTSYATGLINLARNIGGSAGIALINTLLARRMQFHHHTLIENINPMNPNYQTFIQGTTQALIARGSDASQALQQAQGLAYGMLQREAAMKAFVDSFWMLGVVFLLLIPLMLFMKKTAPHKGPMVME